MKVLDFSLILPCYNEGPTFERSVGKILSSLKGLRYEIIFVEDKSSDQTKLAVKRLVSKLSNARAIYHGVNLGRGKAVSDGINASKSPICGYIDVDCEISPKYVKKFVNEIKAGADLVVGKRMYERKLKSLGRVLASFLYSKLVKLILKLPIDDTETGYKFFNKRRIRSVLSNTKDNGWFWDTEICANAYWSGLKVIQVPVMFVRRPEKKSTVLLIPDSLNYFYKLIILAWKKHFSSKEE